MGSLRVGRRGDVGLDWRVLRARIPVRPPHRRCGVVLRDLIRCGVCERLGLGLTVPGRPVEQLPRRRSVRRRVQLQRSCLPGSRFRPPLNRRALGCAPIGDRDREEAGRRWHRVCSAAGRRSAGSANRPTAGGWAARPSTWRRTRLSAALDDAGLSPAELDGLLVSFGSPGGADADTLAFTLGLNLRFYSQTWGHGRFTATCVQHAAMAVRSRHGRRRRLPGRRLLLGRHPARPGQAGPRLGRRWRPRPRGRPRGRGWSR